MADVTLSEAAEVTGIAYDTLKKHAQRGQIQTYKGYDGRTMIRQEDLDAYVAARSLLAAIGRAEGEPAAVFSQEIAAAFASLPASLKQAIAEDLGIGLPQPSIDGLIRFRLGVYSKVRKGWLTTERGHIYGGRHGDEPWVFENLDLLNEILVPELKSSIRALKHAWEREFGEGSADRGDRPQMGVAERPDPARPDGGPSPTGDPEQEAHADDRGREA